MCARLFEAKLTLAISAYVCRSEKNVILLNKVISKRFQSHFSEYALMILKLFFAYLCIYMDKSLVVFWKSFLVLLRFLVKNAKKQHF